MHGYRIRQVQPMKFFVGERRTLTSISRYKDNSRRKAACPRAAIILAVKEPPSGLKAIAS